MNGLSDLNASLFKSIEALDNDDLDEDSLQREIQKSEAKVSIANAILGNASLALKAQKLFIEYGTGQTIDIPLLGISNEDLLTENKNLRRRLASKEAMYD